MQSERVQICSKQLLSKAPVSSWFVPLEREASVHDILRVFAEYILHPENPVPHPILKSCFESLMQSNEDCMFVFMRRWSNEAAGILRSNKPLCSVREQELMRQLGRSAPCNLPLWTWSETSPHLTQSLESQCRRKRVDGHCMAIWCYR